MTHKHSLSFLLMLLCFPSYGHAQLWSGIIAPTRATAWTKAGVKGGIPSASWTQCGSTIAAYTGTAATINNAIAACGTNQYVQLGAGTFTLSTGIQIKNSNVVLRGMGADQTFLVFNITRANYCGVGAYAAVEICNGVYTPNSANWTAGYSEGTTQIALSNTAGISVGTFLILDQNDDASDGWPATGDIYVCQTASDSCSWQGGGGNGARSGRAQTEFHEVTAISGGTITITPPIAAPNFRSSQSPGAYWQPTLANQVTLSGVENLSIDWSQITTSYIGAILMADNKDCWINGVGVLNTTAGIAYGNQAGLYFWRSFRNTMQDSYIFGPTQQQIAGGYATSWANVGELLVQNNIWQSGAEGIIIGGPDDNTVISYNYFIGENTAVNSVTQHGAGNFMQLTEGNILDGWRPDAIHGSKFMLTVFRNMFQGVVNHSAQYWSNPIFDATNVRFSNVVGNVFSAPYLNTYQVLYAYNGDAVYGLGWPGNPYNGLNVVNDPNVPRTLLRWGNWDNVTNATRWCGGASVPPKNQPDTGWTTTCNSTSEVPSGIKNFPNPIPSYGDTGAGQSAMPASFYLSSKPSWWVFPSGISSTPWPGIGPDVTGGNISNTAGHAWLNPAGNCYLNVMHGRPDGSGGPLSFNAGTCYPPTPPTDVEAVAD